MRDSGLVGGRKVVVRLWSQTAWLSAAIDLPVNSAARSPNPDKAMARILIAEDEDVSRALCARVLGSAGHEVATAGDGGEALDVLTREQGRFDLLLTDICMPIMDGIALACAAARDFPGLTILLMTACDDQRARAGGLDALIHEVLPKPFSLAALRGMVNEALAARPRGCSGLT